MSRIDELIREHCPGGVRFRPLGEVLRIKNGKDHKALADGEIPVYGSGGIMRYADTAAAEGPSVLIPRKGSLGNLFYVEGPFWVVDTIFRTEIDTTLVEPKFVYYQLLTMRLGEMNQAGGVPSQTQSALNALAIPVPPLEVQREIVKVLDTFTELEAELEAERLQYAHYRDTLLTFPEGVRRIPMGELAEIRSGWGFPQAEQGLADGDFAFYKVGDMNLAGNETEMTVANNYITSATARRLRVKPAPAGTTIFPKIGAAVATNKKRLLTVDSAYDNNVMGLVPGPQVLPRYLFYWMQTFDLVKLANDSGAVPSIRKSEVEQVLVPVPDLEEQERIVGILDRFDALVNSLTGGLPAELQARRQQYEYYRDKLLTFEGAAA